MVPIRPLFSNFLSFLLLLFHLGCFIFSPPPHHHHHHPRRRHSSTTGSTKNKLTTPKTTLFSLFKRLFSPSSPAPANLPPPPPPPPLPSPSSSTRSLHLNPPILSPPKTDIHPCSLCGQILPSPSLLDHHHSTHHPLSDLTDGADNIIRIIFKTGWPQHANNPNIHRILKIHNTPKTISQFENYRETVKSKAAAKTKTQPSNERCAADGNELLRFHCTTFICELAADSGVCGRRYCSLCGIIRSGFSPKMDGISTMATSYAAHLSIPADIEEEFQFMHVKRAVLVCRVVAGRVGCDPCLVDKENAGFESLAGEGEDELLVFNPRAVLPCFVIVYTVEK